MRLSASSRAVSIRIGTLEVSRIEARELEAGLARHHHVEDQMRSKRRPDSLARASAALVGGA